MFYLESKDQIDEDLLVDFKDADGSGIKTGALANKNDKSLKL